MLSAPEAERAVIGSFLIEKEAISSCIDLIQPEQFNEQHNQALCRVIYKLFKENRPADVVAVIEAGKADGLSFPSLSSYLAECIDRVSSAGHASYHAKTVLDSYYANRIFEAAKEMANDGSAESLKRVQELVLKREAIHSPPVYTYTNGLHDFLDTVGKKSKKQLYRTGYASIDSAWYGAGAGEVITIGAATNVGKSAFCLNLMNNMASRGIKCLYMGTEMGSFETTSRHLSMVSGVEAFKLRIGSLDLEDQRKIHNAIADKMYSMPVAMFDHPSPTLADISAAIINTKAQVVYLDYLSRFSLPKAESYRHRVAEFMVQVKTLARKHDVVIFLAAQLGRQTYGAGSPKPTLADLSESKSIEAESDKVLLMWSDPNKQKEWNGSNSVLSFINMKNRQGKKGQEFDMILDGKTLTIKEAPVEVGAIPEQRF